MYEDYRFVTTSRKCSDWNVHTNRKDFIMKKMFSFLLAMVMLFSCVSAASAAEVAPDADETKAVEVVEAVSLSDEGVSPQSDGVLLYGGTNTISGTDWVYPSRKPTAGYYVSFAVHPHDVVTVKIQVDNGRGGWDTLTTAKPPVGETWQYLVRQASGRNYRIEYTAVACSVSSVIAEYPPVS